MPRDVRPFNATDFARKLVGAEFDELMGRVPAVKANLQRAINANRQLELDRRNPTTKIAARLPARAAKVPAHPNAIGRAMRGRSLVATSTLWSSAVQEPVL